MNAIFDNLGTWTLAAVIMPPIFVLAAIVDMVSGDLESQLGQRASK